MLSVAVSSMSLTRGILFAGPVASFTDANTATSASQFVATINWGDGRSSVATVSGASRFVRRGRQSCVRQERALHRQVTVIMTGPISAGANGSARCRGEQSAQAPARARLDSSSRQEAREAGENAGAS